MNGYRQFCGAAKALDVLGERWTLLIVRDLLLGPRRYTDLQLSLRGITTNLLAQRLKHLAQEGLIERVPLSGTGGSAQAYALTAAGREVEPVVLALGTFGARYLQGPDRHDAIDPRWAMVSLKRRYEGSLRSGRVQFRLGDDPFRIDFDGDRIDVRDGELDAADASLVGPVPAWFDLLTRRSTLPAMLAAQRLAATGSKRTLADLLKAIGVRTR